ncbi:hypothetical protein [Bradyrhizobium sp. SRS-191]|uniref:hypothetical protein n=1 Tax=Bradyrhizobium sp. SRS-191 TaxID=2962606 RepID=UPI00211E9AE0|nr:hypothetical protein [Bradyrhizobium sp. SRS-191]
MTMGYRNRPRRSHASYGGSPIAGRVVVVAVFAVTVTLAVNGVPLMAWLAIPAAVGAGIAVLRPEMFE